MFAEKNCSRFPDWRLGEWHPLAWCLFVCRLVCLAPVGLVSGTHWPGVGLFVFLPVCPSKPAGFGHLRKSGTLLSLPVLVTQFAGGPSKCVFSVRATSADPGRPEVEEENDGTISDISLVARA